MPDVTYFLFYPCESHTHISHLIDLGFSAVAIAGRVGHESIDITYRYSHLFPSKQVAMADKLDEVNASYEGSEPEEAEGVFTNEKLEEKAAPEETAENDNKILNIQKYLVG